MKHSISKLLSPWSKQQRLAKVKKKAIAAGPRPIGRKEARAIAKFNMEKAGVNHINRRFSGNWKHFIPTKTKRLA